LMKIDKSPINRALVDKKLKHEKCLPKVQLK